MLGPASPASSADVFFLRRFVFAAGAVDSASLSSSDSTTSFDFGLLLALGAVDFDGFPFAPLFSGSTAGVSLFSPRRGGGRIVEVEVEAVVGVAGREGSFRFCFCFFAGRFSFSSF